MIWRRGSCITGTDTLQMQIVVTSEAMHGFFHPFIHTVCGKDDHLVTRSPHVSLFSLYICLWCVSAFLNVSMDTKLSAESIQCQVARADLRQGCRSAVKGTITGTSLGE